MPQRRNVNIVLTSPASPKTQRPSAAQVAENPQPERLELSETKNHSQLKYTLLDPYFGNASLTFFSDNRLSYLSSRLRNDKVNRLIQRISSVIASRLQHHANVATPGSMCSIRGDQKDALALPDTAEANAHIKLYFERIHPIYPFLDQKDFEAMAHAPYFADRLAHSKALYALYNAVVALGCQAGSGGKFEPGKGRAWQYMTRALAVLPDLFSLPDSLDVLQAMTALTIYSLRCVTRLGS
ncbi:uncharacterized protein F4817DRAFT_321174 [Daldinia loculata]|uniref:uncharacterized protein n=1 Tax=Daldinia loculata TaxID=103429 RepID=UPI0020C439EF|nr:uncharacterized protein F4817DRAFT_321174 [Daldinia loculata]KAI1642072.1 hypothetical protein F4817DRAFT_321174 [Daldinia loculata]